MTPYGRLLSEFSDLDPTHLETLAVAIHSTLDGLPREAFRDVAEIANRMGADRLAEFNRQYCA